MKIDRLIGILSVLLQEEKTTAPRLAEQFEVSRRTINRDIEDLCKAGIPIVTLQGTNGGIRIMDGHRMDRTILSSKDMQMILAGLRSLDSISGSCYYTMLMEKIKAGSSAVVSGSESILIDLSSWDKASLSPKIEQLLSAIELGNVVRFQYFSPDGNSERSAEPYYLIFKWANWYMYGFCHKRQEFRMFKLNRMTELVTAEAFEKRKDVPMPDLSVGNVFPERGVLRAVFDSSMRWHLVEEFGADSFREQPDDSLFFEHSYAREDYMVSWLLTCRDKVTVLEPPEIREELFRVASNLIQTYAGSEREEEK